MDGDSSAYIVLLDDSWCLYSWAFGRCETLTTHKCFWLLDKVTLKTQKSWSQASIKWLCCDPTFGNNCRRALPGLETCGKSILHLEWDHVDQVQNASHILGKNKPQSCFLLIEGTCRDEHSRLLYPNDIFAASKAFFACFINNIHWAHGWYHAELHKDLAGWFFQPRFASLQPWYSQHLG